jgi:hypothetical protein
MVTLVGLLAPNMYSGRYISDWNWLSLYTPAYVIG